MVEAHRVLNELPEVEARAALTRCCGAARFADAMLERRPFASDEALSAACDAALASLGDADWMQAFAAHPRLGADTSEIGHRFASTAAWSTEEQSGTAAADAALRSALADANTAYAARFGFTFILCATGRSAADMLRALEARLPNEEELELRIAASEQRKITHLRLEKLAR